MRKKKSSDNSWRVEINNMMELNILVKNFQYDKRALKELHKAYLLAKAEYETIKELEDRCNRRVLKKHEFYVSPKWAEKGIERGGNGKRERILDPEQSYLMTEKDAQEYYTLTYIEYKKKGIAHPKGRCYIPSSESREVLKYTENLLMDYVIALMPDDELKETLKMAKIHWKYRDMLLDLCLKLDCGEITMEDFRRSGYEL